MPHLFTRRKFFGLSFGYVAALACPKPLMALATPAVIIPDVEVAKQTITFCTASMWNKTGLYQFVKLLGTSQDIKLGSLLYWDEPSAYTVTTKPDINKVAGILVDQKLISNKRGWIKVAGFTNINPGDVSIFYSSKAFPI